MTLLRAVLALVLLAASSAAAERFEGRSSSITDGRTDTDAAAPLVVVLHGLTGSGRIMQRKTGFDALARTHRFVVGNCAAGALTQAAMTSPIWIPYCAP